MEHTSLNRIIKNIKFCFDCFSIVLGIACFLLVCLPICGRYLPICESIYVLAGFIGIGYITYAVGLLTCARVTFDYKLVHGNFLLKVIAVVLLTPFVLNLLISFIPTYTFLQIGGGKELTQGDGNVFWGQARSIFYHFVDPGNQHMASNGAGQFWSALIAMLGIFLLNGVLISSITGAIDRRKERWIKGELRYSKRHLGSFAVVIGANEVAPSVICNLLTKPQAGCINNKCEADNHYVILQTNREAQQVREELLSHLSKDELQRVIIYNALRDSRTELEDLHLAACTEIYVLGESTMGQDGETYHDAMNMRCVNLMARILQKKKTKGCHRKVCKVMFEYQTTYSIFQFSDISQEIKDTLIFIPFNRYDSWARRVMVEGYAYSDCKHNEEKAKITYTPLDGEGIHSDSDEHVHLVIVGMSKMGIAMGVQAMLQAHYVNYAKAEQKNNTEKKNRTRTRITFIDTNADKERDFFMGRYKNLFDLTRHRYVDASLYHGETNPLDDTTLPPWIDPMVLSTKWHHLSTHGENFIDLEIEFIKGELESEGVRKYLSHISNQDYGFVQQSKLTVAICLTQTHQAIAASLYMPISIYEKAQNIWVYQRESADIILNFKDTPDKRYQKLRPFGMLYSEYMSDRLLYLKSLLVNEAYYLGITDTSAKLKETMQNIDMADKNTYCEIRKTWKKLSIDKQFSNKYFVDSISQKIRSVGGSESDMEELVGLIINNTILARCEHNRWVVQQLILGYSPADKNIDDDFHELNEKQKNAEGMALRNQWRENVGWDDLTPIQRIEIKETDEQYAQIPHGIFDAKKKEVKEGKERIHPNICDYNHLAWVDYGAQGYDTDLNNAIPHIIKSVDHHPSMPQDT